MTRRLLQRLLLADEVVDAGDERSIVHGACLSSGVRRATYSPRDSQAVVGVAIRADFGRWQPPSPTAPRSASAPRQARWVIAATVLGSGIAFLDGTIVNVALPAIGRDLKTDVAGLQWTVDAYLVMLTALLLFGGALGDRFGRRRIFVTGLVSFTIASVACASAPDATLLAIARAVQGAAGALLVPGSLAIIGSALPRRRPRPRDRRVVGARRRRERGRARSWAAG